jgi:hypothetical protein
MPTTPAGIASHSPCWPLSRLYSYYAASAAWFFGCCYNGAKHRNIYGHSAVFEKSLAMKRILLTAALIALTLPSALFGQFVVTLDPATARLTYFPPSFGPGIPGGVPNEYELHFGMQGMFTLDELPGNQGDITQADLVLLGNDAAFQGNAAGRAQVQETARQILLNTMFTAEHGPPLDRTVFRGDVSGPDLVIEFFRNTLVRIEGGPDTRAADGPGYQYTYPIPEPSAVALLLAGCACAVVSRAKKRISVFAPQRPRDRIG